MYGRQRRAREGLCSPRVVRLPLQNNLDSITFIKSIFIYFSAIPCVEDTRLHCGAVGSKIAHMYAFNPPSLVHRY